MTTIGQRFKKIRNHLSLSQADFGESLGMSKSGISAVENDKVFVSVDVLRTLFFDKGVNLDWFISGNGEMFNNECENTHVLLNNSDCVNRFKSWGDRLCNILSENMITPKEFAKRAGINPERVENFILNSAEPTMAEINAIKSNIDVSIDELFYGEKVNSPVAQPQFTADEILKLKKLINS